MQKVCELLPNSWLFDMTSLSIGSSSWIVEDDGGFMRHYYWSAICTVIIAEGLLWSKKQPWSFKINQLIVVRIKDRGEGVCCNEIETKITKKLVTVVLRGGQDEF